MAKENNPMTKAYLEKVTVNVCVGNDKQGMVRAEKLLRKITEKTPVTSTAKKRIAQWQIRPGLPIGYKVTLRDEDAKKFIQWILESRGKKLSKKSLDENGNFSIGVHEYLELNGMKYDAEIGIIGFEVTTTFSKPGHRIKTRRLQKKKIPQRHRVTRDEVISFMEKDLGVKVE